MKINYADLIIGYIYEALPFWINKLNNPIDKFDCIFIYFWIFENKPTIEELLKIPFFAKFILYVVDTIDEDNISAANRIEIIKNEILKYNDIEDVQ